MAAKTNCWTIGDKGTLEAALGNGFNCLIPPSTKGADEDLSRLLLPPVSADAGCGLGAHRHGSSGGRGITEGDPLFLNILLLFL